MPPTCTLLEQVAQRHPRSTRINRAPGEDPWRGDRRPGQITSERDTACSAVNAIIGATVGAQPRHRRRASRLRHAPRRRAARSGSQASCLARPTGILPGSANGHPACCFSRRTNKRGRAGSPPAETGWKPILQLRISHPHLQCSSAPVARTRLARATELLRSASTYEPCASVSAAWALSTSIWVPAPSL